MITEKDVHKISELAKINISEEEIPTMVDKLSDIMAMISSLKEVNTDNIEPLVTVCDEEIHMRKDEVTDGNIAEELFSNVPGEKADFAKEIKCFVVPKMVE